MHDIGPTQLEAEPAEFGEFGETEVPLSEMQEVSLTAELLEATSDQEFEQFFGNLFNTVGNAVGSFVRSDTGQALGGILRDAARQALPIVGRAVGTWISPDGGDVGAQVANQAGQIFGLELEGLSPEDREFETARHFVRFAASAARNASLAPPTAPAPVVANRAAVMAARTHAPGLLPRLRGRSGQLWPRTGRWIRRGRTIVLYGE
jgi:hypothetical protein